MRKVALLIGIAWTSLAVNGFTTKAGECDSEYPSEEIDGKLAEAMSLGRQAWEVAKTQGMLDGGYEAAKVFYDEARRLRENVNALMGSGRGAIAKCIRDRSAVDAVVDSAKQANASVNRSALSAELTDKLLDRLLEIHTGGLKALKTTLTRFDQIHSSLPPRSKAQPNQAQKSLCPGPYCDTGSPYDNSPYGEDQGSALSHILRDGGSALRVDALGKQGLALSEAKGLNSAATDRRRIQRRIGEQAEWFRDQENSYFENLMRLRQKYPSAGVLPKSSGPSQIRAVKSRDKEGI